MSGKYSYVYRNPTWRRLRPLIAERDRFLCRECGAPTLDGEVHHVTALKDGGAPYDPDNLKWLCRSCHRKTYLGRPKKTAKQKVRKPTREDIPLKNWRAILDKL